VDDPNRTAVAPVRFVPVILTVEQPEAGPDDGETLVTVGGAGGGSGGTGPLVYVNWSAGVTALVPDGPVTVTSTVPLPAGDTAVICESLLTVKLAAGVPPKLTVVASVNPDPLMVTVVPPAGGPDDGLTALTVGSGGDPE
jgi:hypothetical protein